MTAIDPKGFLLPDWVGTKPVGRLARGYSMGAIKDGWVVIHDDLKRPMRPELLDELCVVLLTDGRCLVRFVKTAHRPGRYDLLSVTGPPILDAELVWAEPVTLIIPYKPTPEDMLLPGPNEVISEPVG